MKLSGTDNNTPKRRKLLICIAIIAVILGIIALAGIFRSGRSFVGPKPQVQGNYVGDASEFSTVNAEQSHQKYKVRIYSNDPNGNPLNLLQITRDGKILYSQVGYKFYIGHIESAEEYNRLIPIGRDITGGGIPNLVVSEWSGGMHCCSNTAVFEIGQNLKKVATIDCGHSDTSHFEKAPGKTELVFRTYDFTFANWNTSFADSPAPELILRYCDGEYRIADDLMRRPRPSRNDLLRLSKKMRKKSAWIEEAPSPPLWSAMLDLIYSGNAESAWLLFDMAWPRKASGKDAFLKEFREQSALSAYAEQIKMLNAGIPVCGKAGR